MPQFSRGGRFREQQHIKGVLYWLGSADEVWGGQLYVPEKAQFDGLTRT